MCQVQSRMHKHAWPFPSHLSCIWPSVFRLSNAPQPSIWENTWSPIIPGHNLLWFGYEEYLEQLCNSILPFLIAENIMALYAESIF